jgi:hypothetical protein
MWACTWQAIMLKVSHVKHIFNADASCLEDKDLGISKAWKFLCNAKAVECQWQFTYNAAQGGNVGFAQRLCYKKGIVGGGGGTVGEVVGWSTPWKKTLILLL